MKKVFLFATTMLIAALAYGQGAGPQAVSLIVNGGAATFYKTNGENWPGNSLCDGSVLFYSNLNAIGTSALAYLSAANLGRPASLILDGAAAVSWGNMGSAANVFSYRVYKADATPPTYSTFAIDTQVGANGQDSRHEVHGKNIDLLALATDGDGMYVFEAGVAFNGGTVGAASATFVVGTGAVTLFPVTLKVTDYSKGASTDAPDTWAVNGNIYTEISDNLRVLNPGGVDNWAYGMFNATVNFDNRVLATFPNGLLTKEADKWVWQITFQALPGSYTWDPLNILTGWTHWAGVQNFSVDASGNVTGSTAVVAGPSPDDVRIACIGNSNTEGHGVDGYTNRWPERLEAILGEGYYAANYGKSGATLQDIDYPWKTWVNGMLYNKTITLNPNLILIALGTNDSKARNWSATRYKTHYISLINDFKTNVSAKPEIYLMTPVRALIAEFEIVIENVEAIRSIIGEIAKETGVAVIDGYAATENLQAGYISDGIHINNAGSLVLAQRAAAILQTPKPQVVVNNGSNVATEDYPYAEYRWYRNNVLIPNATAKAYTATEAGAYKLAVKLTADAEDVVVSAPVVLSEPAELMLGLLRDNASGIAQKYEAGFTAYIAQDVLHIVDEIVSAKTLKIVDVSGTVLLSQPYQSSVSVAHLPAGIYFVVLQNAAGERRTAKVLKPYS